MRWNITAKTDRYFFFHLYVQIEVKLFLPAIVNSMGHNFPYLRRSEHLEISPLKFFHRKFMIHITMQLCLDILTLRFGNAGYIYILKDQRRQTFLISNPTHINFRKRNPAGHSLLDRVDHTHRTFITDIHQFLCFLEVQQWNSRETEFNHHAIFFWNIIIRLLHNHRFQLIISIIGRFVISSGNSRSENKVRMKSLFHRSDREIIVNTAIKQRNAVFPDRLEKERESHGSTDSISQISVLEYDSLFIIDVRTDTTERDKQIVKIPSGFSGSLRKQCHKRLIHLDRIDKALR